MTQALLQAGMHGTSGGLRSIDGSNFMSGLASGAVSSLISSGIESFKADKGGKLTIFGESNSYKALLIASGGLSGGISSSIAGGNFWMGVRQGIITSGLNHWAHDALIKPDIWR